MPKCLDALKEELAEKISRYTSAGWWVPATVRQAVPMLCILKKNGKLCTVFALHMQNENSEKDVSPFLDQDAIWHDITHAVYRSKLDMSEAHEQICICDEDIPKTAFTTIFGTFMSRVMQQGDCNAPSTFQRSMTSVFRDFVLRFIHVYLDDIFIYSLTIEEHKNHLAQVFNKLWEAQLYLSQDKVDLYSERMDCLGHIITNAGTHACANKMQKIWDWRQPCNFFGEVQRFLGLVQYLAHFMPDFTAYTSPLMTCVHNGRQFVWTPLYDKCLESIKALVCRAPILKPIEDRKSVV